MQAQKYVAIVLILTLLLLMGSNCGLKTTEPGPDPTMVAFPIFNPPGGPYENAQSVSSTENLQEKREFLQVTEPIDQYK